MKNEINNRYGRLLVIAKEPNIGKLAAWLCQCDCGNKKIIRGASLRNGYTKSCGCMLKEHSAKISYNVSSKRKLPYSDIRIKRQILSNMKRRCYNSKSKDYKNYGGRGIIICDEWLNSNEVFYKWLDDNNYQLGLQINRIDNDGNYEPINCDLIKPKENARNKRTNVIIEWNDETKTLVEWAEILKINENTLWYRIFRSKWTVEQAFTTKVK
jgi:hypothetical protein